VQVVLKLLIATIVLAHGVGHLLFLAPTLRIAAWAGQSGHSWALAPLIGDGLARATGGLIWVSAIGLFVAAVGGFVLDAEWWRPVAMGAAVVSVIGIVVMWDGIAPSSAVFALVVDLVVLVALTWARWPSPESVVVR
jgi:hypothetical protein